MSMDAWVRFPAKAFFAFLGFLSKFFMHVTASTICDRICEKVPFSHTNFDPFFEL